MESLRNFFGRSHGRMEANMADQAGSPTTPGTSGVSLEQVQAAINAALQPIVAAQTALTTAQTDLVKNVGVIADTIKQLPPAQKEAAKGKDDGQLSLTADSVKTIVADLLKGQQQSTEQAMARQKFIGEKLKAVPAAYAEKLGNDPAKWESEATGIAKQYGDDLRLAGFKPTNLAASITGTPPAAQVVDISKMSGSELLASAVEETGRKLVSAGEQSVTVNDPSNAA